MSQLKQIRKERGLTLEAVAFLAGCDPATVSRIERGLVVPNPMTVVAIAKALRVKVSRIATAKGRTTTTSEGNSNAASMG